MKTRAFHSSKTLTAVLLILCLLIFLCGCDDGSSSSGADSSSETGEVVIGLTDAAGDFVSYVVDVTSVSLTKQNGGTVETLPLTTTVDFAEYTDMTEFLTIATVPAGAYTEAALTLDYSNAEIFVENEAGEAVEAAAILDENGDMVSMLTVSLNLETANKLIITRGAPAHLTLDFDLAASNEVAFDAEGNPEVTVLPILTAEIEPTAPKIHRLRGPLKSVTPEEDTFTVVIRPFRHSFKPDKERFGAMQVFVNSETVYDINGSVYEGDAGIAALAGLEKNTGVVVLGDLLLSPRRFEATEVKAGSSIEGGEMDGLTGNVIRRTMDTLTISGWGIERAGNHALFNKEINVLIGEETQIRREFSADELSPDSVTVGQRISAFGTLSDPGAKEPVLDATSGYVYLKLTTVRGTVVAVDDVSAVEAPLAIALQSVDNHKTDIFDFATAGIDPAYFEVATGDFNISSLAYSDPVKLIGFFAEAPQTGPDFEARTLISVKDVPAVLTVNWQPPSTTAFPSIAEDELIIDLTGTGVFHHLNQGFVYNDLNESVAQVIIQPESGGEGLFSITEKRGMEVFVNFSEFAGALQTLIDAGKAGHHCTAHGTYDAENNLLTADRVQVHLK